MTIDLLRNTVARELAKAVPALVGRANGYLAIKEQALSMLRVYDDSIAAAAALRAEPRLLDLMRDMEAKHDGDSHPRALSTYPEWEVLRSAIMGAAMLKFLSTTIGDQARRLLEQAIRDHERADACSTSAAPSQYHAGKASMARELLQLLEVGDDGGGQVQGGVGANPRS